VSLPAVHRLGTVASTLDLIHEQASRGAPSGTVVVADQQREGRGSRGRAWHSPAGGLWLSILLRDVPEPGLESLSLRIGLAVAGAIESVVSGLRLGIKWPNDLMLGERKVGGVLCEARWQGGSLGWVAVGVGINVTNPIPPELETSAIALSSFSSTITVEHLAPAVIAALRELPRAGHLSAGELAGIQGRDWLNGRVMVEPVPGIARGISREGALLVEQKDGRMVQARAGHVRSG
jgi:BirA family biotin operon repressor/biotin-[acetyl-CoA-carboxylase] ligase